MIIQEELVKSANELLSKGKDADVTVIGIMAVFCLVMGFITWTVWKQNKQHVADLKNTQKEYLTTLITLKTVMAQIDKNSEKSIDKIESNGVLMSSVDMKVQALKEKLI